MVSTILKNSSVNNMNKKDIGEFIKKSRKVRDWTQDDLAVKVDVSLRTIQNIEKGNYTNDTTVNKILDLFGFELNYGLKPKK